MLSITTKYPKEFNEYLIKKIKGDLKKSSLFFHPSFIFRDEEYSMDTCIDSLSIFRGRIFFKLEIVIKHLVYNRRQLFWLEIMKNYQTNLGKEFFLWKSKQSKKKRII